MHSYYLQILLVMGLAAACSAQLCGTNVEFRNNSCLRGDKHTEFPRPRPEDEQYQACHQWQDGACCTANFTRQLATATVTNIDGFHWNRCGNLSKSCQNFFVQIECFYRCSPHVAHFARDFPSAFGNMPLCHEFCDDWFTACADDSTCVTNWIFDWVYLSGSNINVCPDNATCRTFRQVYNNSEGICNMLWGPSFFYSRYSMNDPNRQCFIPHFPVNSSNPNEVAVRNLFFPDTSAPAPSPCPSSAPPCPGIATAVHQFSTLTLFFAMLMLVVFSV